jgi:hypothetical protein
VGEGEGDAFRAGGDNIDTLTAIVGKGWAKDKGAVFRAREARQDRVGQGGE